MPTETVSGSSRSTTRSHEQRQVTISINVALLSFVVMLALVVGGWVWSVSQLSLGVRLLQTQMVEQRKVNEQQTETLQKLSNALTVISAEHERLVMPHVLKQEKLR